MVEVIEGLDTVYGGWIPYKFLNNPKEYTEIMQYYTAYNTGADFSVITGKNYEPPMLAYKKIKALIGE